MSAYPWRPYGRSGAVCDLPGGARLIVHVSMIGLGYAWHFIQRGTWHAGDAPTPDAAQRCAEQRAADYGALPV